MPASKRQIALTEPTLMILVALWSGPSYGYEIRKWVRGFSHGRVELGNGTVYETLPRLEQLGWIREAHGGDENGSRRERRLYELTETGRTALCDERRRLHALCELLASRGVPSSELDDSGPAPEKP
jgi:DNA-binding PadR family transcriptional regulator